MSKMLPENSSYPMGLLKSLSLLLKNEYPNPATTISIFVEEVSDSYRYGSIAFAK
jgi:hypothetical protein